MQVTFGLEASAKSRGQTVPVNWDSKRLVNGHCLISGMSGSGKTFTLRKMVRQMQASADTSKPLRFHIFDVHGDVDVEGASSVMFSEQTNYGMNPLRVNGDPHYGGLRKRVQGFISTMNRVMRALGGKQEAALRNILMDIYQAHGFSQDDPSTWTVDEGKAHLISDGSDNRLYLDVPRAEKDQAKALGARWDGDKFCWWISPENYKGGITSWRPKTAGRSHPSIADALNQARLVLRQSFMGSDQEAINNLEIFNRATTLYQKKVLDAMKKGEQVADDDKLKAELEKTAQKAIDSYTNYVASIKTGRELDSLMKYDSVDVLKSVVDRLENLNAIGIFKATPPPFDSDANIWRYNLKALSMEERKLFVLFRLEEIFANAVQRGEQDDIVEIVVLDEAHIYLDDDPDNIMNTVAKEARKFGLAMICASQSPTHFTEDFISSVGTKIILGIDEMYWRQAAIKMNVPEDAIKWIKLQSTMLVQAKEKGNAKNDWKWTVIPNEEYQATRLEPMNID